MLIVFAAAAAWEMYVRSIGYAPTLNDTEDLWVQARRRVNPESVVIVGDSRPVFDLDLDELEKGLGKRPVQLALPGSCAYPVFADLANDESFHGTIICSIVPGMFFAPGGPLLETSEKALSPLSQADAGATGEPSPGHVPRRAYRVSQTGGPHARRPAQTVAHPESPERSGPADIPALFSNGGS